jgi:hypothetical protein
VDVILDQWDMGPGDDVTKFMERAISRAGRVLIICTEQYVAKADGAIGGVGYETMILSAELMTDLATRKFIPIIRQTAKPAKKPRALATRFHIDLSTADDFELGFERIIRELHQSPLSAKPLLGKNPFDASTGPSLTSIPAWFVERIAYDLAVPVAEVAFKNIATLERLHLGHSSLGDSELQFLDPRIFLSLKQLGLGGTRVTNAGLHHVGKLVGLVELNLSETRISDLSPIESLVNLEELSLCATLITDNSLDRLWQLSRLRRLLLINSDISDKCLPHLQKLKHLEYLDLANTRITDAACDVLRSLRNLRILHVPNALSDRSVRALRLALANTDVQQVASGGWRPP